MPKPFLTHQAMFDPSFPAGRWYYFKSCDVAELSDEIIDITAEHSLQISSPLTTYPIWQMGGAVDKVGDDETAFNGRSAGFTYNIGALHGNKCGIRRAARVGTRLLVSASALARGGLCELLGATRIPTGTAVIRAKKYERLQALKRKYQPG